MPTLLPSVWTTAKPAVPYVWSCSECNAVFDMGPLRGAPPNQNQIDKINRQFEVHCKHVHPRSPRVDGLGRAL